MKKSSAPLLTEKTDSSDTAQASAADTLPERNAAPLGFLHPDGSPVTLANCQHWSTKIRAENIERTKVLRAMEQQGPAAELLVYADLVTAARLGILRLRAWSALEELAREAVSFYGAVD